MSAKVNQPPPALLRTPVSFPGIPGFLTASCLLTVSCLFIASVLFTGCAKQFGGQGGDQPLTIDSLVPNHGVAGAPVRIFGKGFSYFAADNKLSFNGTTAPVDSPTAANALLTAAPAGGSTGPVTISYHGQSVRGPVFRYDSAGSGNQNPLSVIDIRPDHGKYTDTVIIDGSGFNPDKRGDTVYFINVPGTVIGATQETLTVIVPEAHTGNIYVYAYNKSVKGPVFTYDTATQPPPLTVTDIQPAMGKTGDTVTVYGHGFNINPAKDSVYFNNVLGTVIATGTTGPLNTITVIVPASSTGNIVVHANGQSAQGSVFTYTPAVNAPVIAAFSGGINTPTTAIFAIQGQNFSPVGANNLIKFGNVTAPGFQAVGSTELTYNGSVFDVDNPGILTVTVGGQTSNAWNYNLQPEILNSANTDDVTANQQDTLQGYYFGSSPGIVKAYVLLLPILGTNDSIQLPPPTVLSWSGKQIVLRIPDYLSNPSPQLAGLAGSSNSFPFQLQIDVGAQLATKSLRFDGP